MENKKTHNEILAAALAKSLRNFAENPEAIENFESYLSYHFTGWFQKYASTPAGLVSELDHFSNIA